MKSRFGSGFILGGRHPQITSGHVQYSETAAVWRSSATLTDPSATINAVRMTMPTCYEADDLGVKQPPNCGSCMNCNKCSLHRLDLSRDQQVTVNIPKDGLKLDTEA